MLNKLDIIGTIFGVIGAIIVALNIGYNQLGYIFFTISSLAYIIWAIDKNKSILVLNSTFFIINIIGLIRY